MGVRDLVVLSHLRWAWVWQRPQHVISRLARWRGTAGARTWFVEEPLTGEVDRPRLHCEDLGDLTQVRLVVPPGQQHREPSGFQCAQAQDYGDLLVGLLADAGRPAGPDVWLYTPMAFDLAQRLRPRRLVYDVMDDLASFRDAPEGLLLRQRRTLAEADLVFAGGRSLQRAVAAYGRPDCHLFASGVETAHYERSRALRRRRTRPVAGFVGVIDERMDLALVGDLAAALADWTVRLVGPVTKIDPGALPQAANLEYPGMTAYDELPAVLAGFNVALLPFALNDATRSISPTKTLEYLAAGLPVVSTRVPDVVADYGDVVHLADDGVGFAAACREALRHPRADRDLRLRRILARQEWDAIAATMARLLEESTADRHPGAAATEVPA